MEILVLAVLAVDTGDEVRPSITTNFGHVVCHHHCPPAEWDKTKHLSDVDIGKILGLAKALCPQRKISSLMKCSRNTLKHILATSLLKPAKDVDHGKPMYEWKTSKR